MKLLIYTHVFAPLTGGVERYVMLLAQGLARGSTGDGHEPVEVVVATPTPAGDSGDALPFPVVRQPTLRELLQLLRAADVIHLAGPSFLPMLLGWIFRKPVVVEHSGYQAICPNGLLVYEPTRAVCPGHFMARNYSECLRCNSATLGWLGSLRLLLLTFPRRWLCSRVARNVGPSKHVGNRVALPQTVTILHGIEPTLDARCSSRADAPRPPCFAYVGRLVKEKAVDVLLRAAEQLVGRGYDFHLKIIGDGPERARLEEMADRCGLRGRVVFTGFLHGDDLSAALRGADVAVMPSVWEDVAPLAALEQMMQGRPLVASDIGGLGEFVGEAGLKFPPGDWAALAECLRRMLDDPSLIQEVGRKARERAMRLFTQDQMVREHVKVYQEVARRSEALA